MKAHKQISEFLQCICGNELGVSARSIKCNKCGGNFNFLEDKKGVVFDVLYHPEDIGAKPLYLSSQHRGPRNNWREKTIF